MQTEVIAFSHSWEEGRGWVETKTTGFDFKEVVYWGTNEDGNIYLGTAPWNNKSIVFRGEVRKLTVPAFGLCIEDYL